ncbi:energy transducer TonB [Marimonas sp. MJW-29]|uniref:Energy transducer TonB n=1 Tax=Sulfitobacter sediminis TaxID=3234186 RepID=A0ABV3RJX1_9RHOB
MHTGHVISGLGHLVLILWMLIGGWLRPAHEPFELTQVSVISGAEFEAMLAAQRPPQSATEVAQPAAPSVPVETPEVASNPDTAIELPAPVQTETPSEDSPPEVTELELRPETQVEDTPPDLQEPVSDVAVLVPEIAPEAAPRPVERVAPQPVAQPQPEATPDPVEQQAVTPDAEGEAPRQEQQEATAPEEATTEIVTEATSAPARSARPPGSRPSAPPQQTAEAPRPEPAAPQTPAQEAPAPVNNDDVLAALQAAEQAVSTPTPTGPPLTAGEREALRVAVAQCWNIGSLSSEALATTVVIGVQMNQNGTPVIDTIRMLSFSGGSDAAARRVFDSARRAIIRCGSGGFDLPAEKYGQWQTIEMTFDPRKMGY